MTSGYWTQRRSKAISHEEAGDAKIPSSVERRLLRHRASYNALRLATALSQREDSEVRVFLMGDAVNCGKSGQKTPTGFYNVERMLRGIVGRGAQAAA